MHLLLWLILFFSLVLAAGFSYQWLGSHRDRGLLLKRGTVIDLGEGLKLYCSQQGSSGTSVVFEAGIAATSQNWTGIQESVSGFAQTFSYDRAGLGWSSAAACARTPSNLAHELHRLLQQAAVPAPYLLVGHSFGGFVVRRYAVDYPDDVAGVLLIDPMRVDDWPPVNEARRASVERGIRLAKVAIPFAQFGVVRLAVTSLLGRSGRSGGSARALSRAVGPGARHVLDRVICEVSKMPRSVWPIVAAHWSSPGFYRGLLAHLRAVPASVVEMEELEPITNVPVCLLTPVTAEPLSEDDLRRVGKTTVQVIAGKSGHWIHLDEPSLVVSTIEGMLGQIAHEVSAESVR